MRLPTARTPGLGRIRRREAETPRTTFGYGIPMAGVRYYTFGREA